MGYKLLLFDLDGTLLDADKHIPERNRAALEKAAGDGIEIVPSTGRFYNGMPEEVRALPLHYAVTINGAAVVEATTQKTLRSVEIPADTALRIFDDIEKTPAMFDCYQDNWGWMTRPIYGRIDDVCPTTWQRALVRSTRSPVDDLRSSVMSRGGSVQKIQEFFAPEDLALRDPEIERLKREYPELSVTSSVSNNIEINAKDANKGSALLFLCELLGIDPSESMTFGDGLNDVTMLEQAGTGVAMANAPDEVKQVADYVTTANVEAGIAHALEAFDVI